MTSFSHSYCSTALLAHLGRSPFTAQPEDASGCCMKPESHKELEVKHRAAQRAIACSHTPWNPDAEHPNVTCNVRVAQPPQYCKEVSRDRWIYGPRDLTKYTGAIRQSSRELYLRICDGTAIVWRTVRLQHVGALPTPVRLHARPIRFASRRAGV